MDFQKYEKPRLIIKLQTLYTLTKVSQNMIKKLKEDPRGLPSRIMS